MAYFTYSAIAAGSLSSAAFPLLAPNGSAAAPSYSFVNASNWGWYYSPGSGGFLRWSVASTDVGNISSAGAFTIGAASPATGVFHTINADSATNNKGLAFTEKTATQTTVICRGDVNTGGILIVGGGSGANGGQIAVYGASHASLANQVRISNGTGVTGAILSASGAFSILGTLTNDNATAGFVGEYIQSVISSYTNIPGATGVWGNLTSISLTAGDWCVTGILNWIANGAIIVGAIDAFEAAISVNSGATTTDHVQGSNQVALVVPTTTADRSQVISSYRISLSATTTVYFKLLASYSVATPQYKCRLSARRVR